MIRECVTTHGVIRPLEPERDLPALHDPSHLGLISPRWAQIYLAGIQRHEKKYAGTMRQIARRRERAIALLRSQDSATEKETGGGEGWSAAWALEDSEERPPPSSLVARCDTAEALALARSATATKRKRNARLAEATSVSVTLRGTQKRRTQDGEEEGKKAARSRPAGELWRRLSRGRSTAPVAAPIGTTGSQPQVVVAA